MVEVTISKWVSENEWIDTSICLLDYKNSPCDYQWMMINDGKHHAAEFTVDTIRFKYALCFDHLPEHLKQAAALLRAIGGQS